MEIVYVRIGNREKEITLAQAYLHRIYISANIKNYLAEMINMDMNGEKYPCAVFRIKGIVDSFKIKKKIYEGSIENRDDNIICLYACGMHIYVVTKYDDNSDPNTIRKLLINILNGGTYHE